MNANEKPMTTKIPKVLIDAFVVAEFPDALRYSRFASVEARALALEKASREFEEFVRDHRSRDTVSLNVERVYEDQCSACGAKWEPYEDDGKMFCGACGVEVRP